MNFKIDTKEKFTVITPELSVFDAKIAADLWKTATSCMNTAPGNVIMNFQNVATANGAAVNDLSSLHQHFFASKKSFVICHLTPAVYHLIKNEDLVENLNITPTESEAWDVVQMEEIERELMGDTEV